MREGARIQSDIVRFVLLPRGGVREKKIRSSGMEQGLPVQHRRPDHFRQRSLQLPGSQQQGDLVFS